MLEGKLLTIPREVPRKRPIQIAPVPVEREIPGIEDIAVIAESLRRCFANELLVFGTLEILSVRWEDDDDILLWVRRRHCSELLLCPAVAVVLIVGVAADKAADTADEAGDGARDEAGHFWMNCKW